MQIPDVCGRRYRVEHLAKQLQPDVGGSVRKVQRRYRHAQILPHEASRRKNCRQLSWGRTHRKRSSHTTASSCQACELLSAGIRKQFPIPEDEVFLNNGTVGSSLAPVLQAVFDGYHEIEKLAPEDPEDYPMWGYGSSRPFNQFREEVERIGKTLSPIRLVFLDLLLDGCLGCAARLVLINRVFARRAL